MAGFPLRHVEPKNQGRNPTVRTGTDTSVDMPVQELIANTVENWGLTIYNAYICIINGGIASNEL